MIDNLSVDDVPWGKRNFCMYIQFILFWRVGVVSIVCPYCDAQITMSKKTQLWLISMMAMIPVCIVCAVIDGNSKVDSVIEYASIGISFIGLMGLIATYQYEEVKRNS